MIKNCANVQFARSKYYLNINLKHFYSKTLIYRGVCGKETSAINQGICGTSGFCLFTLYMLSPIWGKGDGHGVSGFAINRGTVNHPCIVNS